MVDISTEAGQIAMQTLMSLLVNLYIGEFEDHDLARNEITNMAEEPGGKLSVQREGHPSLERRGC